MKNNLKISASSPTRFDISIMAKTIGSVKSNEVDPKIVLVIVNYLLKNINKLRLQAINDNLLYNFSKFVTLIMSNILCDKNLANNIYSKYNFFVEEIKYEKDKLDELEKLILNIKNNNKYFMLDDCLTILLLITNMHNNRNTEFEKLEIQFDLYFKGVNYDSNSEYNIYEERNVLEKNFILVKESGMIK